MLENDKFRRLLTAPRFVKRVGLLVVDEAHMISQWGGNFHPEYKKLEKLHVFAKLGVPILAASATLTPSALEEVKEQLKIRKDQSFCINLGNDRPNLFQEVRYMKSAQDWKAIDFVLDKLRNKQDSATKDDIPHAIIFVNKRTDTHAVAKRLRDLLGPSLEDYVGIFHAVRSPKAKLETWDNFVAGKIQILVATEAATLVSPHTSLTVNLGLTSRTGNGRI